MFFFLVFFCMHFAVRRGARRRDATISTLTTLVSFNFFEFLFIFWVEKNSEAHRYVMADDGAERPAKADRRDARRRHRGGEWKKRR